jgi:hypothetical protein
VLKRYSPQTSDVKRVLLLRVSRWCSLFFVMEP